MTLASSWRVNTLQSVSWEDQRRYVLWQRKSLCHQVTCWQVRTAKNGYLTQPSYTGLSYPVRKVCAAKIPTEIRCNHFVPVCISRSQQHSRTQHTNFVLPWLSLTQDPALLSWQEFYDQKMEQEIETPATLVIPWTGHTGAQLTLFWTRGMELHSSIQQKNALF